MLTFISTACWLVCFWWMWRISSRQDALLKELHKHTQRIARLTKAEHDLIQEVHPQVGAIKEAIEQVAADVPAEKKHAHGKR
ncbi:MAG TPA: hypothetical protein VJ063_16160 [Verrucomicrobiae bacterium]|nr:hypothetical protein [Verrucomicrobiae bacterium]